MHRIDLNCDLGEEMPNDETLMPLISSANIACGYHAGNEDIMRITVDMAIRHQVAIGAHPSFPDRDHFGRRTLSYSSREIVDMVSRQLETLSVIIKRSGARMIHVKPHGALYNMAASDETLADAVVQAIRDFDPELLLFALAGSQLIRSGKSAGLSVVNEVFADRSYQDDGSLTPRELPGALISDPELAALQVVQMVEEGTVRSITGMDISIVAETLCIHGDGLHAVEHAQKIRALLEKKSILVLAP